MEGNKNTKADQNIEQMLAGGDMRSIGNANKVVKKVLADQRLFAKLFACLSHDDPRVRMRSADALEKVTQEQPELLQTYKKQLLEQIAQIEQQEVEWHVAQMIPRLDLEPKDMSNVREILDTYLKTTQSNIVRVMSLQAFADLALQGKLRRDEAVREIERYAEIINTPSVQARSRKLLKQLKDI